MAAQSNQAQECFWKLSEQRGMSNKSGIIFLIKVSRHWRRIPNHVLGSMPRKRSRASKVIHPEKSRGSKTDEELPEGTSAGQRKSARKTRIRCYPKMPFGIFLAASQDRQDGIDWTRHHEWSDFYEAICREILPTAGLIASFFASPVTRAYGRRPSILLGGVVFLGGAALGGISVIGSYAPILFITLGFCESASLRSAVVTGIVALRSIMAINLGDQGELSKECGLLVLILVCYYVAGFGLSWGPLGVLIPSEIFPLEDTLPAGETLSIRMWKINSNSFVMLASLLLNEQLLEQLELDCHCCGLEF
ncbi:hypothetical protein Tco_0222909 [Tanacetum coccineum]